MPVRRNQNSGTSSERQRPTAPQLTGDVLAGGVVATSLTTSKVNAAIYGRNGVGKTTLACQGEGPIAIIAVEPSPTGGARSVADRPDIVVFQAASRYLVNPVTGLLETIRGSEKVMAVVSAIADRFRRGERPFRKVVLDGVTSWNDVILGEVLKLDYQQMPAILGLGKVSADQYIERGECLVRYLKPLFELPCDVWVVAQERDHNPPKDVTVTKSGKEYRRPTQTPFMREAHPMAQEGSFFSLGVADTPAKWIQDACDFVMQLYEDDEYAQVKDPDIEMNGQVVVGETRSVPTGRRVKRLRCTYHPNYAARCRGDYRVIPEYIEAPTPEERYAAFLDLVAGRRSKWGHYSQDAV